MNIPGQCLVSAKCWRHFIALGITRVTRGPFITRGPDLPSSSHASMASEGHTIRQWGVSHHPDPVAEVVHPHSTTHGSARLCVWDQYATEILLPAVRLLPKSPQPPSHRWTWTSPCPPSRTLEALTQGMSPVMDNLASAVKATARLNSPLTAFIRNQDQTFSSKSFQLNLIARPRRMPQL